jgi:hypothetical protein
MNDYHTALTQDTTRWPVLDMHMGLRGVSFQADLNSGIPEAMYNADIWYTDLPWRVGYFEFAKRAGVEQSQPYTRLLKSIGVAVATAKIPAILITGKHAIKSLSPESIAKVTLNNGEAVACLWGYKPWVGTINTVALLKNLAAEYQRVGDFCCGYGRAGKIFAEAGKRYVMSDLNGECIGYIAAHERTWV